jgi:hypothetical protein
MAAKIKAEAKCASLESAAMSHGEEMARLLAAFLTLAFVVATVVCLALVVRHALRSGGADAARKQRERAAQVGAKGRVV